MPDTDQPELSVVIPVYNEQDNVRPLYDELTRVLGDLGKSFEILFVNDGSADETGSRLAALQATDSRLRVVNLDGNFGEAAALSAGFHAARAGVIVTLDGDGQNDPADIPRLLESLGRPGVQVVSGRRDNRQEGYWLRLLPSLLANALIVRVTGVPIRDCGCGLKAYRRSAIPPIHLPRGMNRFLPAIFGVGPRQVAEVRTRDRRRQHGQSHYGLSRTIVVLRDLLALRSIIHNPRQAELRFGLAMAGAAALGALLLETSWLATAAFDGLALLLGLVWWNVRRFNRAQTNGVYRLQEEAA